MKKLLKTFISSLLVLSVLVPAVPSLALEEEGMKPLENLKALSGSWSFGDTITCSEGGDDKFALSDSRAENFIFEADVEFVNKSGAASLVFLSPDNPMYGGYVANIDLSAGNARIFRFNSPGNATTKGEYKLTSAQKAKSAFNLRVEVNGEDMVYFLDGEPIVSIKDSTVKSGDRLGLLTYKTSLRYTNVRYTELTDSTPELTELTGLSTAFSGQSNMKEKLPFGTTELSLTATAKNGELSAAAQGADVTVDGKNITVSNISSDFDLVISVTKGSIVRSYVVTVEVEPDPDTVYNEEWRAQYHFSTLVNWINDPNGLVYDPSNRTWHLFYQYNPYGLNIANQVWGHAVSTDLMHWRELDIAIEQDSFGAVFSGSCVVDENNTSGFFTDNKEGESKLVALYTSDGGDTTHGVEKQCIAYSKDHGVTWIKPDLSIDKNIVISNAGNKYGRDFRDPKIFQYDGKWFMVIAGGRARLFASDNLIDWELVCDMGFDSECPDFYPLAVDGDENNIKWVYTASGDWYIIGRLEKKDNGQYQFIKESDRITYNGGGEVYATQSFFNDGSGANRRIAISWLQDNSASTLPGKPWNGAQSLPFEQTLRTVNGKIILTSEPVAEVDALHGKQVINENGVSVEDASKLLSDNPGKSYDLEITFKPSDKSVTTLVLRDNGTHQVKVVYDAGSKKLSVIRGKASSYSGNIPSGTMEMPLYPDKDGNVKLRVLMDTTVINVIGNDGEAACTGYIFPDADCINSYLTVNSDIEIKSMQMWRMTSIWHTDEEILPESGIYFDAPAYLPLDEEITVNAYFLNENGERSDAQVTWGEISSDLADVVSNQGGTLVLKGKSKGKLTLVATLGEISKNLSLSVADIGFDTNLEGWTSSGDWFEGEKGWSISGSSGDSFTFSSLTHEDSFTYTGIADFNGQGGCLGLVFGATNPASPKSGTWYGANVDTHSSQVSIKLFCNTNGNEVWNEITNIPTAKTYTLTVTYEDGTITYMVNGQSVSHKIRELDGGTFGLVSWNGGGSFNEVYAYTDGAEPPATDDTPSDPPVSDGDGNPSDTPADNENGGNGDGASDKNSDKTDNGNTDTIIPVVIGISALVLVGAAAAVLLIKKKKS